MTLIENILFLCSYTRHFIVEKQVLGSFIVLYKAHKFYMIFNSIFICSLWLQFYSSSFIWSVYIGIAFVIHSIEKIRHFLHLCSFAIFCTHIWLYMNLYVIPSITNSLDSIFFMKTLLSHSSMDQPEIIPTKTISSSTIIFILIHYYSNSPFLTLLSS